MFYELPGCSYVRFLLTFDWGELDDDVGWLSVVLEGSPIVGGGVVGIADLWMLFPSTSVTMKRMLFAVDVFIIWMAIFLVTPFFSLMMDGIVFLLSGSFSFISLSDVVAVSFCTVLSDRVTFIE